MHRQGLLRSPLVFLCLALACGDDGVTASGDGSSGSSSGGGESSSTNPATTIVDESTSSTSDTATSTESSEGSADSSSSTGAPNLCGNGDLDDGEECDDSNVEDGDACHADCTLAFEVVWTVLHNGDADDEDDANRVWIDPAGNIYALGEESVTGEGSNVWLQQYLPDGTEGWTYRYDGGAGDDEFSAELLVTDDGDFIVAGNTETDTSYYDILLLRIDGATQMLEWSVVVDGPGMGSDAHDFDRARGLAPTDDGGFVAVGSVSTDAQGDDVWIGRYDALGTEVWTTTYDDAAHVDNTGRAVLVDPDGQVLVFAQDYENFMSTGRFIVYDADGMPQAGREQTDDVAFERAIWNADGDMIVTGSAAPTNTLLDVVTRKYDAGFTQIWEVVYDGALDFDFPYGMHVDEAGNVYVVGVTYRVNEQGNSFVQVYDGDGNALWSDEYNDAELDITEAWYGVATDANGDVVVAGFEPVLGQQNDTFVRKYHPL